jgi:predicted transcriptional regulator
MKHRARRSKSEIVGKMLKSMERGPARKTSIMYASKLNYSQLLNYLSVLFYNGLAQKDSDLYSLTEKGKNYLMTLSFIKSIGPEYGRALSVINDIEYNQRPTASGAEARRRWEF